MPCLDVPPVPTGANHGPCRSGAALAPPMPLPIPLAARPKAHPTEPLFCSVSAWEASDLASQYGTVPRGSGCREGTFTSARHRTEKTDRMLLLRRLASAPFHLTNKQGANGAVGGRPAPRWPRQPLGCGPPTALVCRSSLHASAPSCTSSDPTSRARGTPWSGYLHHANGGMLHKAGELAVGHFSAPGVGCTRFSSK